MPRLKKRPKSRRQRVSEAKFAVELDGMCCGRVIKSSYGSRWDYPDSLPFDFKYMYEYLVEEPSPYAPSDDPTVLGDFNQNQRLLNERTRIKFMDYFNGFQEPEYYYGR